MLIASLTVSGILAVLSARGFVLGIRHEPGERASPAEWLLGGGVGVLAGAMIYSLLHSVWH